MNQIIALEEFMISP